jgi:hypothetical protein
LRSSLAGIDGAGVSVGLGCSDLECSQAQANAEQAGADQGCVTQGHQGFSSWHIDPE